MSNSPSEPSFREYLAGGWKLCAVPAGTKGPRTKDWNLRVKAITDPAVGPTLANAGLLHAWSGSAALDIDKMDAAAEWLAVRGIDLDALLAARDSVQISSGREGRAKLLYRLPSPLASLKLAPYKDGDKTFHAFELRCASADGASVQDILPPSIHVTTGLPYRWVYGNDLIGHWSNLPLIPNALLALWKQELQGRAPKQAAQAPVGADHTEIRALLDQQDPDCTYDDWVRIGAIVHHETKGSADGLALWDAWSKKGAKYGQGNPPQYPADKWSTFRHDVANPATLGSLRRDVVAKPDDFPIVPVGTAVNVGERPQLAFTRNKSGRILSTTSNAATALREPEWCRFHLAFDSFRDEVMIAPLGTSEWRPLSDEGITRILEEFERSGFMPIARDVMSKTLSMVGHQQKFDSAILWLNSLKWDGVPRVGDFLAAYCGVLDSPYARAVSLYLWTALAGRVLEPGCKADMVPILVGPQGAKKTSAVAALVPSADYFTEVNLMERDTDLSRKLRGRLVGEIGELRGLSTRDLESVKTLITRTHEDWIPKYQEFAVRFPRRLVFIGTTNNSEFLADETGHRRWLPVEVGVIDIDRIKAHRLQLWAEGAVMWKQAGIAWHEAEKLAPAMHQKHVVSDSWEALIDQWLDRPDHYGEDPSQTRRARPFSTSEVMSGALDMTPAQMTRANEMRTAKVLKSMGFRPRVTKLKDKSTRVWVQR